MVSYVFAVLLSLPCLCSGLVLPKQKSGESQEKKRPHILFIMVDEMDGRIFDDSSDTYQPPMKNIRKLIRSGTHFRQAYTAAPLCTPARASMMTGRHSSDIGVVSNGIGLAAVNGQTDIIDSTCFESDLDDSDCHLLAKKQSSAGTFIDALYHNGYGISLYGKLHVGAGLARFAANIGQVMSVSAFGGMTVSSDQTRQFAIEWTRATGILPHSEYHPDHAPVLGEVESGPASIPQDYATAKHCHDDLANGLFKGSQPQFLYCSFETPHPELKTNKTFFDRIHIGAYGMPPLPKKETVHPADRYTSMMKNAWGIDMVPDHELETARKIYFAMCEEADDLIGHVLDGLDKGGGKDNAYVMLVSDHGDNQYENYLIEKETLRDSGVRIPFILSGPDVKAQGSIGQLASLHDVYPTLLDIAGARTSSRGMAGESLLPIAKVQGKTRQRDYVIAEFHARDSGTGEFMIAQGKYKLIAYGEAQIGQKKWQPQLFDLSKDPHEEHDISKKYPAQVTKMYKLLNQQRNIFATDKEIKEFDKYMFLKYFYYPKGGASQCMQNMGLVYRGFDVEDAQKVATWLGQPCGGHHENAGANWRETTVTDSDWMRSPDKLKMKQESPGDEPRETVQERKAREALEGPESPGDEPRETVKERKAREALEGPESPGDEPRETVKERKAREALKGQWGRKGQ